MELGQSMVLIEGAEEKIEELQKEEMVSCKKTEGSKWSGKTGAPEDE